jgi:hypothetical protein
MSLRGVPRRLDFVRFLVDDDELEVAFTVALELAERAARARDEGARAAASRIRGAGASSPIRLSEEELAALAVVIDDWEAEARTVRRLRERLP